MSDADELAQAKRRVGDVVLGQHGVHGVGTSRAAGEVVVRVDAEDGGIPDTLMKRVQSLAEPFGLRVISEAKPGFALSQDD
jgi:hypothetical protein